MSEFAERYNRNIGLFGAEGQRELLRTKVAIVGVGGLGSAMAQHIALLGVEQVFLIDDDELDDTNRNRFIGARHDDPVPGSAKVNLAARLIKEINPDVRAIPIQNTLVTPEAFSAIKASEWMFGCFDGDGPRHILNELCAAYLKNYIDLASDVTGPDSFGGRICVSGDGDGCLMCLGLIDRHEVRRFLEPKDALEKQDAIYGVPRKLLGETGPAVSPQNAVVAGLAATEFMVGVTGMRRPRRLLNYYGDRSLVTKNTDLPEPDCRICKSVRGTKEKADVERYLLVPHLSKRRQQH